MHFQCIVVELDFYRKKGNLYQNGIPMAQSSQDFVDAFRDNVLGWCEKNVQQSNAFDMNILEAIKSEYLLLQRLNLAPNNISSADASFQDYLRKLELLALPWVLSEKQPQTFAFTCLHKELEETINSKDSIEQPMFNVGFSRYKITRMNLLYGLCATDINNVAGENSSYQLAYQEHLAESRQRPPKLYTPHINRYWDSPAFLPELNDEIQKQKLNDIYRAVLYTLANHITGKSSVLINKTYDMEAVWHESPARGETHPILGVSGNIIPANTYGMIIAFACNYDLVGKALDDADAEEKSRRNHIENLTLLKNVDTVISKLRTLPQEAPQVTVGVEFREALLFALVDEVQDIFYHIHGMPNSAFKASESVLIRLMEIGEQLTVNGEEWGVTLKHYAEEAVNTPKY